VNKQIDRDTIRYIFSRQVVIYLAGKRVPDQHRKDVVTVLLRQQRQAQTLITLAMVRRAVEDKIGKPLGKKSKDSAVRWTNLLLSKLEDAFFGQGDAYRKLKDVLDGMPAAPDGVAVKKK